MLCRGQVAPLMAAALLFCVGLMSLLAGIQLSRHINLRRREQKFVAYTAQVKEVNDLMENLEARFEISSLEMESIRNKTRQVASLIKENLGNSR